MRLGHLALLLTPLTRPKAPTYDAPIGTLALVSYRSATCVGFQPCNPRAGKIVPKLEEDIP